MYHAYARELQTIEVVLIYKHYTNTMISIAAVTTAVDNRFGLLCPCECKYPKSINIDMERHKYVSFFVIPGQFASICAVVLVFTAN